MSKARLDLPEPETPVTTVMAFSGTRTSMPFRLCSRAPTTTIADGSRMCVGPRARGVGAGEYTGGAHSRKGVRGERGVARGAPSSAFGSVAWDGRSWFERRVRDLTGGARRCPARHTPLPVEGRRGIPSSSALLATPVRDVGGGRRDDREAGVDQSARGRQRPVADLLLRRYHRSRSDDRAPHARAAADAAAVEEDGILHLRSALDHHPVTEHAVDHDPTADDGAVGHERGGR